jgi:hypothetical protein
MVTLTEALVAALLLTPLTLFVIAAILFIRRPPRWLERYRSSIKEKSLSRRALENGLIFAAGIASFQLFFLALQYFGVYGWTLVNVRRPGTYWLGIFYVLLTFAGMYFVTLLSEARAPAEDWLLWDKPKEKDK